jgi:DNA repair protein RadC
MTTIFVTRSQVIDYLAKNHTYLYINTKGIICLRPRTKFKIPVEMNTYVLSFFTNLTKEEIFFENKKIKAKYSEFNHYIPINKWQECSRPREIMMAVGAENMSNVQLLTILISSGRPGTSAQMMAQNLINQYHTFRELAQVSLKELRKIPGIGLAKAAQIKSALEIGKRLGQERIDKRVKLKQPEEVLNFVASQIGLELQDSKKECLYVILMDNKMKPIRTFFSSFGSIDTNVVDIQDIIRRIAEYGATSLILVHNHPSGETQPSQEDEETTRRVAKACNLLGVKLVDHVIVGASPEDYFSFQKRGLL